MLRTVLIAATLLVGAVALAALGCTSPTAYLTLDRRPEVIEVLPAQDAVSISRASDVVVTLSEQIDPSTVDDNSLIVEARGGRIAGSVSVLGSTLKFVPQELLPFLSSHAVTLSSRIGDLDGAPHYVDPYSWTFATEDLAWSSVTTLSTTAGNATSPRVTSLGNGGFIAVWTQNDGPRYTMRAARFGPSGWSAPELIGPNSGLDALDPRVESDGAGMAIAVWEQSDGATSDIWFNVFLDGFGWGLPERAEVSAETANQARVAVAPDGTATASWIQIAGTRANLWGARRIAGGEWGSASLLEMNDVGDSKEPLVASDAQGNATVVYRHFGAPGRADIWAVRYVVGSDWTTPVLLEANDSGNALLGDIDADDVGSAIVAFAQADNTNTVYDCWASRYRPGIGWSTPTLLETYDVASASCSAVSLFPDGRGISVWSQGTGGVGTRADIWFAAFDPAAGWTPRALVEFDNTGTATSPDVAVDAMGSGVVVWSQTVGSTRDLMGARIANGILGTAFALELDPGDVFVPRVMADDEGNATVVWFQHDGVRNRIRARVLN